MKRSFNNNDNANQAIKQSFMYNTLELVRVYIGDSSLLIIDLIN